MIRALNTTRHPPAIRGRLRRRGERRCGEGGGRRARGRSPPLDPPIRHRPPRGPPGVAGWGPGAGADPPPQGRAPPRLGSEPPPLRHALAARAPPGSRRRPDRGRGRSRRGAPPIGCAPDAPRASLSRFRGARAGQDCAACPTEHRHNLDHVMAGLAAATDAHDPTRRRGTSSRVTSFRAAESTTLPRADVDRRSSCTARLGPPHGAGGYFAFPCRRRQRLVGVMVNCSFTLAQPARHFLPRTAQLGNICRARQA